MHTYLLPNIDKEYIRNLNTPITPTEVQTVIMSPKQIKKKKQNPQARWIQHRVLIVLQERSPRLQILPQNRNRRNIS